MSETKFYKQDMVIPKGEKEGRPVYTKGSKIRFLGLPTNPNGSIALTGSVFGFEGSFDGKSFFTINDYRGIPLSALPKAKQLVIPQNGLKPAPAILPIEQASLFEGIQMVRIVSNLAEAEDRTIEIYKESADL